MGKKIRKVAKLALASALAILLAALATGLVYRAYRQRQVEKLLAIDTPDGIDEAMFVKIDGADQWITIRGRHRNNPVVLMIHGGPGVTNEGFAANFLPWEKDFTVVQWDQPGAGRTFARAGRKLPADLTINSIATDGIAVAEFLKTHLHKDRLILLGWSWGSIVGIDMVQARPDLFAAYVGTGQFENVQAGESIVYARVLAAARAKGNTQAIKDLESIGPPPYRTQADLGTQRRWAMTLEGSPTPIAELIGVALFGPRSSLEDGWSFLSGVVASQNHFWGPMMDGEFAKVDLSADHTHFAIPIFVIQGVDDNMTPAELAHDYVEKISAPQKAYIPIEGAGHLAIISNSREFLKAMNERVRPLAAASL